MEQNTNTPSELSRKVELGTLRERRNFTAQVESTPAENEALAKRYEILSVEGIKASVSIKPMSPQLFRVRVNVEADIIQACGVSLEPVPQHISEEEEELLTTDPDALTSFEDAEEGVDVPTELITGDTIDYGEIVAQVIALGIDPFPRKESVATFEHIEHNNRPFAALEGLAKPGKKAND